MRHTPIAAALAVAMLAVCATAHADILADTTISGKTFIDFTNLDQTRNGSDTANAGTGMDVKRFYLGVEHKFDDMWSAGLTTDFNYTSSSGETQVFVKKAWVQAKINDAFKVRAGADDMPWIPFVEGLYNLRYIENTLIDRLKYGNSSDWGLHAFGGGSDLWTYNVAAVNGAGYKNPSRGNNVDVEGRFGITPLPGLTFAVGGYSGELGKETANLPSGSTRTANRLDFVAAYVNAQFRVGGEYFRQDNWNNVLTTGPKDSADGYSVWGQFKFASNLSAFARYDHANQSRDINPKLKDTYYNAGVEWIARKGVRLAAVFKHDKLADAVNTTKTNEIGVWAEVAF
ncbi:MAG: carbohydrate porin [Proteobacteria bacterium]|nr:carbohydrate porin [Pseudomonadota bacterium]